MADNKFWFPVLSLFILIISSLALLGLQSIFSIKPFFPYSFVSSGYKAKPVADEDKKTITWIVHMYPPVHNAGGEWMAHAMNKYLIDKAGFKVNVIVPSFPIREFEGVNILTFEQQDKIDYAIRHSAMIVSHLNYSHHAVLTAADAKRPIVLVMHNDAQEPYLRKFQNEITSENIHLINNSFWIQELYQHFQFNSIIVYPPVNWKEYRTPDSANRKYVTLINLNYNKGGDLLIQVAKRMPDVLFLGVEGGYDIQIRDRSVKNIRYEANTPHIQDIYQLTKILLVPSKEESWGRVAVEAMSSGIPVLANPTPGLREACGPAGIFVDRANVAEWVRMIRKLLSDQGYYKKVSEASFERSRQLYPEPQLAKLSMWLQDISWSGTRQEEKSA